MESGDIKSDNESRGDAWRRRLERCMCWWWWWWWWWLWWLLSDIHDGHRKLIMMTFLEWIKSYSSLKHPPLPAVLTKLLTRLLKKVAAFMIDEELAHCETKQYNDEMNHHNRSQALILMWSCISDINGRQGSRRTWQHMSETQPLALPLFFHLHPKSPGQLATGHKAGSIWVSEDSPQTRSQRFSNFAMIFSPIQSNCKNSNLQPLQNVNSAKKRTELSTFSPASRRKISDPSSRIPCLLLSSQKSSFPGQRWRLWISPLLLSRTDSQALSWQQK